MCTHTRYGGPRLIPSKARYEWPSMLLHTIHVWSKLRMPWQCRAMCLWQAPEWQEEHGRVRGQRREVKGPEGRG